MPRPTKKQDKDVEEWLENVQKNQDFLVGLKSLAKLNIEVKDGKVSKKAVQAALVKFSQGVVKADTAESGHLTDEKHDKVLEAIAEWREYAEGYDQPENKMARDMCLKALDCAAHCLSMAADACNEMTDADEAGEEVDMGDIGDTNEEVMDMPDITQIPPGAE